MAYPTTDSLQRKRHCRGADLRAAGVGDSYTVRVRQVISNFHPNNISHCNAASIDGDRPVEPETKPDSTTAGGAPVGAYNLEKHRRPSIR